MINSTETIALQPINRHGGTKMSPESTKDNSAFLKATMFGVAYCALIIAAMLVIWPPIELNLIFKFLLFFGLTFVLLSTLVYIKVLLDNNNRELLIGEIKKLLK